MFESYIGVNDAYVGLRKVIAKYGVERKTRNGWAKALNHPIMVEFGEPAQRILYDKERRANPFFHMVEAIWMLGGANDVASVVEFNSNMATYSDDGESFNAAYGHRWRKHFGFDQLSRIVQMLKDNPDDRRVVLTMWDPRVDLGSTSKDIPCNQQCMFRVVAGRLDMLTTNRSNDLIWGLCGANAFHMSILHEYIAAATGLSMGYWVHVSNNLHVYEQHYPLLTEESIRASYNDIVGSGYQPSPVVWEPGLFLRDCEDFCHGRRQAFKSEFFNGTMVPLMQAWSCYKTKQLPRAKYQAQQIESADLKQACTQWLEGVKQC